MAMKDFIALKQAAGQSAMKSEFEDFFKNASSEQTKVRFSQRINVIGF